MKKICILILDDEREVGEILTLRLQRRGFDVEARNNCNEAFHYLETNPVDVVLLDVKMPDINGIDVLKLLHEKWPECIVIMISGHADMEVATKGLQLGAFSYMLKPVEIDSLCHTIEDAYKLRELHAIKT